MVMQYEDQIYYPTFLQRYTELSYDKKILNFCQYVQFRFNSRALIISGDYGLVTEACTKNISAVWNTSINGNTIEDFLNSNGLRN
jgi:hypothetical protein